MARCVVSSLDSAARTYASPPSPSPKKTEKKEPDPGNLQQPVPFVPTPEPEAATKDGVPDILDPEYEKRIRAKYAEAKAKALQDSEISKLKEAADAVFDPAERSKALKAYYEALFDEMRDLDPDMASQIDRREKATLRRIESTAP